MLVIKYVSLNNNVMLLSTELASTVLSKIIIEALTSDENVSALSNWSHVGVHGGDTIWKHREVTSSPGVGVEGDGNEKRFSFFNEWELIVDCASDGVRVKELSLSKSVSNSAAELGVLEVISESATNDIDGTLTVIWSNEWGHIINDTLSVVMEVSETLLNTFKFDCKWNRSEIVLTISVVLFVLLFSKSSSLILVDDHWALD